MFSHARFASNFTERRRRNLFSLEFAIFKRQATSFAIEHSDEFHLDFRSSQFVEIFPLICSIALNYSVSYTYINLWSERFATDLMVMNEFTAFRTWYFSTQFQWCKWLLFLNFVLEIFLLERKCSDQDTESLNGVFVSCSRLFKFIHSKPHRY